MAADDMHEFLTPQNNDEGNGRPEDTHDFDGGGREIDAVTRDGAVTNTALAKPIKKEDPISERLPSFKLDRFDSIATCGSSDVEAAKLAEILTLISMSPSLGEAQREALYVKAIDLFESLEPSDGIEGMLAMQMVGTHNAAIESLRRAMLYDQSLEAQKVYLSQAERMMGQFTRHLEALDRHRGKSRTNITVGQVNVESGGQAIVGNVEAGVGTAAPVLSLPAAEGPDIQPAIVDTEKPTRTKVRR